MQDKTKPAIKPVSRRTAVLWSLFFSYGATFLILVGALALVPWYLKYISMEEYGAWLATGGMLSFLTIVDLGLMGVLTQQAAVAYGADERERLSKIVGTGIVISICLSIIASLISIGLCPFVPIIMKLSGETASRLSICFLIAAISGGLNLIGYATGGVLKSFQKTFVPGLALIVSEAVNILVIVVLLLNGFGLYSIALGLVSRSLVMVSINTLFCLLECYLTLHIKIVWSWDIAKQMWRLSAYVFTSRIASSVIAMTDTFLVGAIMGPKVAGAYALTIRAHGLIQSFAGRFGDAVMPSLAHLHGEVGNKGRFKEVVIFAFKIQATIAAVGVAGVMAFDKSFVNLWVKPGIYAGNAINIVFGIWVIGNIVGGVSWHTLYAMGELPSLCKVVWLEAIIRAVFSVVLISYIGAIGAPIAALVAQLISPAGILTYLLIRKVQMTYKDCLEIGRSLFIRISVPVLVAFAVVGISGLLDSWHSFIFTLLLYCIVISILFLCLDRNLLRVILLRNFKMKETKFDIF